VSLPTTRGAVLPLRPYLIALGILLAVGLVTYFAFNPSLPFTHAYRVQAVFKSSNGLRDGSPVRIAGITVGNVVEIDDGPGSTTVVTMEIKDNGRPVHRDAMARVRPRVFLEGGFLVELEPGSPSAPELPDNGTLPLAQTTVPVQFHQVLTVLDAPTRQSLRGGIDTLAGGLGDGGAAGLRTLAPELRPLLRDTAWVAEAARGTEPDDVSELVRSTNRIAVALDRRPEQLGSLVDNLATTAAAVRSRDGELAASIGELSRVLRATPPALRALDGALPALERAGDHLAPALPVAPRAFRETAEAMRELGRLAAPRRRARTLVALETAFRDLPTLVGRLAATFPQTKPLSDCLSSHVLPLFQSKVPDGALSSGRPVWQDFVHSLVGLSSTSQNFDGNGHALRYQLGLGEQSVGTLPGTGLIASAPTTLRSRPLPRADRKPPPLNSTETCSRQPQPDLAAASGSAGVGPARTRVTPMPAAERKRLLDPDRLRKLAREARR